ncbi:MAG: hypothetical protein AAFQ22_05330 [Pseudomonadota bacterium]
MTLTALTSELRGVLSSHSEGRTLAYLFGVLAGATSLLPNATLATLGFIGFACLTAHAFVSDVPTSETLRRATGATPRLLASLGLVSAILFFLAVMTLLASGLAAFAIMSGSGFDFDAASANPEAYDEELAKYQETPGWQLAMAVFLVALLLFLGAVARALPFAAASIIEGRIVALEAFNWTRKQGARLLIALAILTGPAIGLAAWARFSLSAGIGAFVQALAVTLGLIAWIALSAASYRLLRRGEHEFSPTD